MSTSFSKTRPPQSPALAAFTIGLFVWPMELSCQEVK